MKRIHRIAFAVCTILATLALPSLRAETPLGSAFTYQGQLKNAGSPAAGDFNMTFALFDEESGGNQVGATLTFDGNGGNPPAVAVANGLFTVELDFGSAAFNGSARWLDVTVNGTPLVPRQKLTGAPYSLGTRGLSVDASDNVGIGTSSPATKLDVNGTVKTAGLQVTAAPGANRVLTSDAAGVGTWQPLPPVTLSGLSQDLQSQLLPLTAPNPANPSVVGSTATEINPNSVAVSGGYAYVANFGSNTLQIFDMSNPASPTPAGNVMTDNGPTSVAVSGGYAYVVNLNSNTLQVFNVSNPASPTLAGSAATGNAPYSIAVSGSYAYLVNHFSNTLQVFDVSNPAAPTVAGSAATGFFPLSVAVSGGFAYVVNNASNTLQIFNVSNPAIPTLFGIAETNISPGSVAVSGGYAYVVSMGFYNTLQVFDVSQPNNPTLTGSVEMGSNSFPAFVAVSGGYAYVVNHTSNTLQIFNVSNPASPMLAGSVATGSNPQSVAVSGGYAYVVNYNSNTLQVFAGSSQFPVGATFAGSVGIGTVSPASKLDVNGTAQVTGFKMPTGAGASKVLTCDASGIGTWQAPTLTASYWAANGDDISNSNPGNVGIGTMAPSAGLHVLKQPTTSAGTLALEGTMHTFLSFYPVGFAAGRKAWIGYGGAGDNTLTIRNEISSGDIKLNTSGGNLLVQGGGNLLVQGGGLAVGVVPSGSFTTVSRDPATGNFYVNTSSRRYKENITPFADDFDALLCTQPMSYTRIGRPDRVEIGYIAEDFDKLGLTHLVQYDAQGQPEAINYDKIPLYLTEIVRRQRDQIERLRKELDEIKVLLASRQSSN